MPASRPFHHPRPGSPLHCGKVSLESLARRYGTPLYVYSADQIAERLALFQHALAPREHLVCYAVKANSALAILKLLARRGAGFDIVSGGELQRVLAAAPDAANRVVFSGVGKTAAEIDLALSAGILEFNVESEAELEAARRAAPASCKRPARFALRVNPDVFADTHPYISTGLREHKFGIDIRQALAIYKSVAGNRWLEAHGVSVHIGSQIRSAQPFGKAMERVRKLVDQLEREGIVLKSDRCRRRPRHRLSRRCLRCLRRRSPNTPRPSTMRSPALKAACSLSRAVSSSPRPVRWWPASWPSNATAKKPS